MADPFTRARGSPAHCRRSDGRSPARACPPDRDPDLDPDPDRDL